MWLVVVLGCAPPPARSGRDEVSDPTAPVFSATGAAPALRLGLGHAEHADAPPGAEATLTFGGQGGFHLDVSGRVAGLGELVAVELTMTRDGVVIANQGDQATWLRLAAWDDDEGWFAGQPAYLLDNSLAVVCGHDGVTVELCGWTGSLADQALAASACLPVVLRMSDEDRAMCG